MSSNFDDFLTDLLFKLKGAETFDTVDGHDSAQRDSGDVSKSIGKLRFREHRGRFVAEENSDQGLRHFKRDQVRQILP